jgi:hypothetical protein
MNVGVGDEAAQFLFWEYLFFQFSVQYICSAPATPSREILGWEWDIKIGHVTRHGENE